MIIAAALLAANNVIAVVNGQPITDADIQSRVAAQLMPIRQKEFDIRVAAAKALAFERLQAAEAARRGITVEELYRQEVTAKVPDPPEAEVAQYVTMLAPRLPSDPAAARAAVVESLRNQDVALRETAFREELFARAKFDLKLTAPRTKVNIEPTDAVRGSGNAPVTIIEFSDFQCPYCNRSQETVKKIVADYEGKVRLVFKHLPLEQLHENARIAAEAAACAWRQDGFWKLHDWMFENSANLSREAILTASAKLGIDDKALAACIDKHLAATAVDADVKEADRIGVGGTPAFFVNGRLLGDFEVSTFREAIDQELQAAKD